MRYICSIFNLNNHIKQIINFIFLPVGEQHTCDKFSARLEELPVATEGSTGFSFSSLPKFTSIT